MKNALIPEIKIPDSAKRFRSIASAIEDGKSVTELALRINVPVTSLRNVCFPKPRRNIGRPRSIHRHLSAGAISMAAKTRTLECVKHLRSIADAIEAGEKVTDIALRINVPFMALRNICLPRARQYVGHPRAIDDKLLAEAISLAHAGKKTKEISQELHVNLSTLQKSLSKRDAIPRYLRAKRMKKAIRLYKEGVSPREIVKKCDVSITRLYLNLKKAGVSPRYRRKDS